MKFERNDSRVLSGLEPIDRNDPAAAASAVQLSLPENFSAKAWRVWEYFDDTAFLFEYKGQLVVTDESLELTDHGTGSMDSPIGFPRWVGDSWEALEKWLEVVYEELKEYEEDFE